MSRVHSHKVASKFIELINDRRFHPYIFATALHQEDRVTNEIMTEIIDSWLHIKEVYPKVGDSPTNLTQYDI